MKQHPRRRSKRRTPAPTLLDLLRQLKRDYPKARIVGHYHLSPYIRKTCHCFDAIKEYEALDQPNASAIRLTTHGPS